MGVLSDEEAQKLLDSCGEGYAKHLKELLKRIAKEETPEKAFHALEVLSRNLKHPRPGRESFWDHTLTEDEVTGKLKYVESLKKLHADPAGEDGALLPIASALPNFVEECGMLKWAGVGFSDNEALCVMNALRHFAATAEGLKKVRFWGKILGSENDYFVAEAQTDAPGEPDPDDPTFEALGSGANTYAYWVATDIANPEWVRLPETRPQFVMKSRTLKKVFTGNLEGSVITYPYFEGQEKDFVRAVIARITSMTVLNVKGYLSRNEEDGTIGETEGFVFPTDKELTKAGGWMHREPHILLSGRCTYNEIDPEAEPEQYAVQELVKAADPEQDQLRDITNKDWCFREHHSGVVSCRNIRWPGSFSVYKSTVFTNIYVGYGIERGSDFFYAAPPNVYEEQPDVPEQPEPFPAEGPPPEPVADEE